MGKASSPRYNCPSIEEAGKPITQLVFFFFYHQEMSATVVRCVVFGHDDHCCVHRIHSRVTLLVVPLS